MSLCHLVTKEKGWNSNEAFEAAEKSDFYGKELVPLAWTLGFVSSRTVYMHKKLYNTLKGREKMDKHNRSSLMNMRDYLFLKIELAIIALESSGNLAMTQEMVVKTFHFS